MERRGSRMRWALRMAALLAVAGLGATLAFGYLGRLHPAFDSFSHLRLHLAGLLVVAVPVLIVLRLRIAALLALIIGVAVPLQTLSPPGTAQGVAGAGATYRLVHLNLRYDNATPQAVLSMIGAARADVLALTEVSDFWRDWLALTGAAYPYRLICEPPTPIGGVAILSRRPFAEGGEPTCGNAGAFVRAPVDFGGRTVEIAALHMGWPWPFEHPWQLRMLEPLMAEIGADAIITGDLNAVPWSHAARRLATAANASILGGIGPTWLDRRLPGALTRWIGLPIDNVMTKGNVAIRSHGTLADVGSDHLPVVVEFSVVAEEKEMGIVSRE